MTEHELRAVLSANLKRYRGYLKLSQADLAEELGISIPFLSDVENGRKWISPTTFIKLANALKVEPYKLFKPVESPSPASSLDLGKWSTDVIQAVTQTVNDIQEYYKFEIEK